MPAFDSDRLRPVGPPIIRQIWENLLFLHWEVPPELLRSRLPPPLEADLFEGNGWISITPFAMRDIAPTGSPALPLIGRSLELNVRTYVRHEGEPGIWFFSLDVQNPLMLIGARLVFGLPYFPARMRFREEDGACLFSSRRLPGRRGGRFEARWSPGEPLPRPRPDSIEHFLAERYALFAGRRKRLVRARVSHPPWSLRRARLEYIVTDLPEVHGFSLPPRPVLVHAQGDPLRVRIGAPRSLGP